VLDLGVGTAAAGGPLPITSSRMGCLVDALSRAYDVLGLGRAAGGDEVFRSLVLARIIEPVSKLDSLRVLEEAGAAVASYRTVLRRLPVYAKDSWRQRLSAACAAHARLGPASLVLYDVSVRHEALVGREALGIEGGARPPRRVVAAAGWELSAVRSGRRR